MQKKDAEVVDRGAKSVVGSAGILVLVVDDLLGDLVVGGARLVHVLHLELGHEVERLVEVLLAQHLELDEVVVVLRLQESAVREVAEAVDAGFASELYRPAHQIRTFNPENDN